MNTIFADTSAWLMIIDATQKSYPRAKTLYRDLLADGARVATSNYVLVECYNRVRYTLGLREMLKFRAMIVNAERFGTLQIFQVGRDTETAAWHILEKYDDQNFSFVDATSFALMRENKIARAFAFDDDFRVMGFDVKP